MSSPETNASAKGVSERLFSATRLTEFLGCTHRFALWMSGEPASDVADDAQALFRAKGLEHERSVLEHLERRYGPAARIPAQGASLEERIELTRCAMQSGSRVIYQGAFLAGAWVGFPDFVVRTDVGFRPEDAKLSRRAKRDHVVQLGVYAQLLRQSVGEQINDGVLHVSAPQPEHFDLRETAYITARLMRRLEGFSEAPTPTRPLRCPACKTCTYKSRCESEWRRADSPIFVAGLRTSQLLKLEAAGIRTMSALTQLPPDFRVKGIGDETLPKLVAQARLQKEAERSGHPLTEVLPAQSGRGFALLPGPELGDMVLDFEGDPLYPDGGLEYLFGAYGVFDGSGQPVYRSFWAHNHDQEKAAFESLIALIARHLTNFPSARIYHFASYETTALKRLAMRYGTMEQELDGLLRNHRFVDLYRVVRQGIRASTETYSLKDIEEIYWGARTGAVATAGDSIVQYEKWRLSGDDAILTEIRTYNEEDCRSTAMLRDWLVGMRPPTACYQPPATASEPEKAASKSVEREARELELSEVARWVRGCQFPDDRLKELVAELLWFHQRTVKPQWWAIFERQTWSDEELIDDMESIGGARFDQTAPVETVKRSYLLTCRFPPQDTKLRAGSKPTFSGDLKPAGTIAQIQCENGVLVLKRGIAQADLPTEFSLLPQRPLDQRLLADAIKAFAIRFASGDLQNDRALMDFLLRRAPRVRNRQPGEHLMPADSDLLSGTIKTIQNMDGTALFIQGPPGSGKTFTASHAILALLKDGKRVGVSSNSHKAINLLLSKVEERAQEAEYSFLGVKKATAQDDDSFFQGRFIGSVKDSKEVTSEHRIVGGTVYHFAQEPIGSYDYLFIDEAGQVALGNLVAMAACAKNIVFIGDQMQLAQPIQGVHPGDTGLSCLEYLLQHQATIRPDMGILLNVSHRMHPALCTLISEAVYDGRLSSAPEAARRAIVLGNAEHHPALQEAGISFCIVDHEGCTQNSPEEAVVVRALVVSLMKQQYRSENGEIRPLSLKDILIVSPFNMQVNFIKRLLPEGALVGTVDKFQGQEAPVVIVSMATSHGDDAPRGTDFLFSRNRFNVAISRAKCLAIVVQSRQLLDVSAGSIDDLVRLNLFARAEAAAKVVDIGVPTPSAAPMVVSTWRTFQTNTQKTA